ncbi:hypothetical protein ACWGIU_14030 [Streptomyces sp. NPDC054840]
MSNIIAGDPAPTNPTDSLTAEALLEVMAFRLATGTALVEPNQFRDAVAAYRRQVLAEASVIALELRQFEKASGARAGAQVSENVGIIRVADELMRLADGGESRG